MSSMQNSKLLRLTVLEEMHLQENTFDLDIGPRSHKRLPRALYIIAFATAKLLYLTVKEEMK